MNPLNKIKNLLNSIETSDEDNAQARRVQQCWQIGKLIHQHKEKTGKTIAAIAEEIEANKKDIYKYTQFYNAYKDGYKSRHHGQVVPWHIFLIVLPLKDAKEREFYLKQTCRHNWNKYELKRRLKADYYHNYKDIKTCQAANKLKKTGQRLYTYIAWVTRVVDGDTLVLDIDVGFKTRQEHRVRLRGIDCPEMSTQKGEQAKQFVLDELQKCAIAHDPALNREATPPLVAVKTYKQGMYGRYIVDVYYLPGESSPEKITKNGKLLNQVLLDKGLANNIG
jgi:micrococcal nuclease